MEVPGRIRTTLFATFERSTLGKRRNYRNTLILLMFFLVSIQLKSLVFGLDLVPGMILIYTYR